MVLGRLMSNGSMKLCRVSYQIYMSSLKVFATSCQSFQHEEARVGSECASAVKDYHMDDAELQKGSLLTDSLALVSLLQGGLSSLPMPYVVSDLDHPYTRMSPPRYNT